jgi:hypothetical protein
MQESRGAAEARMRLDAGDVDRGGGDGVVWQSRVARVRGEQEILQYGDRSIDRLGIMRQAIQSQRVADLGYCWAGATR